jgi:hypothetical protein
VAILGQIFSIGDFVFCIGSGIESGVISGPWIVYLPPKIRAQVKLNFITFKLQLFHEKTMSKVHKSLKAVIGFIHPISYTQLGTLFGKAFTGLKQNRNHTTPNVVLEFFYACNT